MAVLPLSLGNAPAPGARTANEPKGASSAAKAPTPPRPVSLDVDGPVALTGRSSDGTSLEGARISVWAGANQDVLEALKPGDAVPRLQLPRSAVTVEGDEFAVVLRRGDLKKQFLSDGDIVQLEVEIYDPKTNRLAVTGSSVRSRGAGETGIPWTDPLQAPVGKPRSRPAAKPNPVLLDVKFLAAPSGLTSGAGSTADVPPPCYLKQFMKTAKAWADIGETYPVDDGGGGMKFNDEAKATYEAAVKIGDWTASGSKTFSSGRTMEWPASGIGAGANAGKPRKYQVELEYMLYSCQNSGGLELYQGWDPVRHTGGNRDESVTRPAWIGSDMDHCTQVSSPNWSRFDEAGGSVGLAWEGEHGVGAKDALEIGIDLSVKREWSTTSEIMYSMTTGANWLCGKDDVPGHASKIAQYSKVVLKTCENRQFPVAKQVEAKAAPEKTFLDYAKTTPNGWTGGDSTYSVRMPDGRILWMFSDTFLGPLNSDGTRPTSAPLVNSSFVIQNGSRLQTVTGGTAANPRAIMPPPGGDTSRWYWLGDGMIADVDGKDHLQVIFHQWHKYGSGTWDFKLERMVVATFELGNLKSPVSVKEVPSDNAGVQWGAAVLPASKSGDGYTYIYGIEDAPTNKQLRVARVKGSDLSKVDRWMFLNGGREAWMTKESEGDNSMGGVANEFSVTKWNDVFVLVSQDSTEAFSSKIRIWSSCQPLGSFSFTNGQDVIYRMPEVGLWGSYGDKNIFAYNAHVHPTLASGDRWTLSYNVNSFDTTVGASGAHYKDPSIYKPRFVSFTLAPSTARR
ncbi:hypothetical protein [Streptomyces netropsis]